MFIIIKKIKNPNVSTLESPFKILSAAKLDNIHSVPKFFEPFFIFNFTILIFPVTRLRPTPLFFSVFFAATILAKRNYFVFLLRKQHLRPSFMKQIILSLLLALICMPSVAQETKLPAPNKNRGLALTKALSVRRSVREFSPKMLSRQDLSDLLWSAAGINNKEGRRTAPSALNLQDVTVYVFTETGVAKYIPTTHSLKTIVTGDHRQLVAGQQNFVMTAPVSLVLVSDLTKFQKGDTTKEPDKRSYMMGSVDVGNVSENINLFCAATGLSTVPRASMDSEGIQKLLHLTPYQLPIMNNPVGYKK